MHIVVDTNVVVSGIFWEGRPRELLQYCFSGDLQMVCTKEIFTEYLETIQKLTDKYGKDVGSEFQSILFTALEFIENQYCHG